METLYRLLIEGNNRWVFLSFVVLSILSLTIWLLLRYRKNSTDMRKIANAMKSIGRDYMKNVFLPDGIDGFVCIDYLILTSGGILVVDVQNYNGFLFGGENMDHWTQMVGRQSYRFDNPLGSNLTHVQVVKTTTRNIIPVEGRVVFSNSGKFPKGIPKGVSMLGTFRKDVEHLLNDDHISESMQKTWDQIKALTTEAGINIAKKRL